MMANKPEMGLAPLIEPLPPSMHAPPRPGSKAGRPGTAGRPQALKFLSKSPEINLNQLISL